jgi:hypothetical protein
VNANNTLKIDSLLKLQKCPLTMNDNVLLLVMSNLWIGHEGYRRMRLISRQSAHEGGRVVSPDQHLPSTDIPETNPMAIARPEGIRQ